MKLMTRPGMLLSAAVLAGLTIFVGGGGALAAPTGHTVGIGKDGPAVTLPLKFKVIGHLHGKPVYISPAKPVGLPPSVIESVYHLSTTNSSGEGQIIAIVDGFGYPTALSDLNTFSRQYGLPQLSTCASLSQAAACFKQEYPQGTPPANVGWDGEQALDIQWAHAMAPGAKIVLVDTKNGRNSPLMAGVAYAGSLNASEVSMSWGTPHEFASESSFDKDLMHPGTLYTGASGDGGHNSFGYPLAAPEVIGVGGTALDGCGATSCSGFKKETACGISGGGISLYEPIPAYQSSYTGPVHGAATIAALDSGKRGIPDVSFDACSGVSVYRTASGQPGWGSAEGTSIGAPSWAGILAAGAAAGKTALQGNTAMYAGGYKTNLRDITAGGNNGTCGTDCTAGPGYDLVTGLGSPLNYP